MALSRVVSEIFATSTPRHSRTTCACLSYSLSQSTHTLINSTACLLSYWTIKHAPARTSRRRPPKKISRWLSDKAITAKRLRRRLERHGALLAQIQMLIGSTPDGHTTSNQRRFDVDNASRRRRLSNQR